MNEIDQLDRRILAQMQRDCRLPAPDLAAKVGTSVSSLRRRLARLRQTGAIEREVAIVDTRLSGIEIIVAVTMREEHSADYDRLKKRFRNDPRISQCYSVTGEADLMLHVHMPNMPTYEGWLEDNILGDPAVRRCTSHVVYSRVKFSTELPLD